MSGQDIWYTWRERFIRGEAEFDEIYDVVDSWHDATTDLCLPEWLGLAQEEYAQFVQDPRSFEAELLKVRSSTG